MNEISKATATAVLPVLLDRRKQTEALNIPVDSYKINRISPAGVKIGCTLVPWKEVELIAPLLAPF